MPDLKEAIQHVDDAAVAVERPKGPVGLLSSDMALTMIAESLPPGMDAKTFQRHAITLVKQTPALLECEGASVAQGIVRGAALGLDPDPALGQMWLVPRNVRDGDTWSKVATFQVGWRGLYELAMRTGRVTKIEVKAVHRHDRFEARLGSGGGLVHEPDWFGDRGPIIGWYAYAQLRDGTEMFEVLSKSDAEAHRDAHASSKKRDGTVYGPWADHFDAMAAKTVFLKLAKWLPKQVERDVLARALDEDGVTDRTPLGGRPGHGDLIAATIAPEPEPAAELAKPAADEPESPVIDLPLADESGEPIESTVVDEAAAKTAEARNRKMWALVAEAWPKSDEADRDLKRKRLIGVVTDDRSLSSKTLNGGEWDDLFLALDQIVAKDLELWQNSRGAWVLRKPPMKRGAA